MALSFPLAIGGFFAGLSISECTFYAPASLKISRTRGGAIKTAKMGERLWTGRATIAPQPHAGAAGQAALVSVLSGPGRSFFAHSLPLYAPIADPTGETLGAATPVIHTLQAGGREMRISGLPAAYVLTVGDYVSFTYGSDPVRYGFHQVVNTVTADGAGLSPLFEVTPPIRDGAVTSTAVTLVQPFIKAVLVPGSFATARPAVSDGLVIEFVQTLE